MPNFLKKAESQFDKVRTGDEAALAALFVRPYAKGSPKTAGRSGSVRNRLRRRNDADGLAFDQSCVLVLTNQRLIGFGHGTFTGRVREPLGSIDLDEVSGITLSDPEGGPATLTIAFADDSSVVVTPGSRRRRFLAAYDEVRNRVN